MEYSAMFEIDGAVSHGFGLKSPDYTKREEKISADSDKDALVKAAELAFKFSRNYLSNPLTDSTKVTLLALYGGKGGLLNQKEVLRKEGFTGIKRFCWDDNDRLTVECSMLEHILTL